MILLIYFSVISLCVALFWSIKSDPYANAVLVRQGVRLKALLASARARGLRVCPTGATIVEPEANAASPAAEETAVEETAVEETAAEETAVEATAVEETGAPAAMEV